MSQEKMILSTNINKELYLKMKEIKKKEGININKIIEKGIELYIKTLK